MKTTRLHTLGLALTLALMIATVGLPASAGPVRQDTEPPADGTAQPEQDPVPTGEPTVEPLERFEPTQEGVASPQLTYKVFVPVVTKPGCQATGASYGTLSVIPPPTDRPAENHADLNLALRSYTYTTGVFLGLVNYGGDDDPSAPQLATLFNPSRLPTFTNAYRVHHWFWASPPNPGTRGPEITDWPTTLIGMGTTPGELIRVPNSGYHIGDGYEVLVLYAAANRITLKYTREDNVVVGYTIHVENICVDPALVSLYQARNSAGRGSLPALQAGKAFGRAVGGEIGVAIRDSGAFMDPRSRKDWWIGY